MREVVVHVDGKPYKGTYDTWEDNAWGQMVEVTRDAWLVRCPVHDESPAHVAERCLEWCVREALADRRR
jgi:hypothetical protein